MIKFHLIFSTILLISMYLISWAKFDIVPIKNKTLIRKIKDLIYIVVVTYIPIINIIMIIVVIMMVVYSEEKILNMLNTKGIKYKIKGE